MNKKIGILTTRGLPPRYGAFEQAVDQIVKQSDIKKFYIRKGGVGVIYYGLKSFFDFYLQGVKIFICFGYGLAPFFWIFHLLGCKIICNVDGFEWRRAKWGGIAKKYFKLCEWFAVKSKAELIYDAVGIQRYYNIVHRRNGHLLFYGVDKVCEGTIPENLQELNKINYFVVVMRMEPENHIKEIVQGFILSNSKAALILIGPSTKFFEENVIPLINNSKDRVKWVGPIYDRQILYAIRKKAIAYLHGHSVGGTNPTLIEACNIGRPIIAYNSIFNKEVLGVKGLYFHSSESLADTINNVFFENIYPPTLDERYTWDYVADGYIKLLA